VAPQRRAQVDRRIRTEFSGRLAVNPTEFDQLVAQIGETIIARLGRPASSTAEGLNTGSPLASRHTQCSLETCALETAGARADQDLPGGARTPLDTGVAKLIDHTLLRPDATRDEILRLCREAKQYLFAAVCVNPYWVSLAASELAGTPVKVSSVIGFPFGATTTESKVAEAVAALRVGAREIDMVMNIGALRSGDYDTVKLDIQAVIEQSHHAGALVKVILETSLLDDRQKAVACTLARMAGADFVKTSTGFGPAGANAADVSLMRKVVGSEMGVKAAGGIRNLESLRKMTAAGATRIGSSASVKIVEATAA
jgi:deoxyribose-phosphate aldolase